MFKRTITYKSHFDGSEKTRVLYFHLGKMDLARIAANPVFLREMEEAAQKGDKAIMLKKIEELIRLSYGVRQEGTDEFIKTTAVQDEFIASQAYEEFVFDLLTGTTENFMTFIQGVFPPKLMEQLRQRVGAGEIPDPFAEPTEVNRSAAAQRERTVSSMISEAGFRMDKLGDAVRAAAVDEDIVPKLPAWMTELRMPTVAEITAMPADELMVAKRIYPEIS